MPEHTRRKLVHTSGLALTTPLAGCVVVTPPPPREDVIGVVIINYRDEERTVNVHAQHDSLDVSWETTQTIPPGETFERHNILTEGRYHFVISEERRDEPYELDIQIDGCPENSVQIELETLDAGDSDQREAISVSKQQQC